MNYTESVRTRHTELAGLFASYDAIGIVQVALGIVVSAAAWAFLRGRRWGRAVLEIGCWLSLAMLVGFLVSWFGFLQGPFRIPAPEIGRLFVVISAVAAALAFVLLVVAAIRLLRAPDVKAAMH